VLPPTTTLAANAVTGPKATLLGNAVSSDNTERSDSKTSEEIAIEVVRSKQDSEKAKLAVVNAELSKYEAEKKTLEEELRVLSLKVADLEKSIRGKKEGLIRDGQIQKQAAFQLESNEKVLKIKELVSIISSKRKDSLELTKRVALDEIYLKTKYSDLQKKKDFLAEQALKKDVLAARKETSRLQATIQAETQLLARNQGTLKKVEADRGVSSAVLRSVEGQISRLNKELVRQRAELERAQKKLAVDEKGVADLKSESAKSAADLKNNISQEKELAKKLKKLQNQLGKYK